jgi:hypothetical protein
MLSHGSDESAIDAMAKSLQSSEEDRFAQAVSNHPGMPHARRDVLRKANDGIAEATLELFRQLRRNLASRISKLPQLPENLVYCSSLQPDSVDARDRGDDHEARCQQWAREYWRSQSRSARKLPLNRRTDPGPGFKMKIDALVVEMS